MGTSRENQAEITKNMSIFVVPSVVSLAGHFDCSYSARGESLGESKIKNRPLRCLRSRLLVPRAGIEPARPFRAKGFSYHYGFRHHFCLWSGLFLHRGARLFRCVVSSLCTFLLSEAWLKIAIGLTRYGFLEFTTFYISLFRECTQLCSSSIITCKGMAIGTQKLKIL